MEEFTAILTAEQLRALDALSELYALGELTEKLTELSRKYYDTGYGDG